MKLSKIDAYEGPLNGYIPLLDELIQGTRAGTYLDAVRLCGATRTICSRFETALITDPSACESIGKQLQLQFESASHALSTVAKKETFKVWQVDHVEKMLANLEYRIQLLAIANDSGECLEDKLKRIENLRDDFLRNHYKSTPSSVVSQEGKSLVCV